MSLIVFAPSFEIISEHIFSVSASLSCLGKKLVKIFHPDINAGDKNNEEKLKLITLAYTQLKKTYRGKN